MTTKSHSVSYAYFTAFNGMLSNLDLLHEVMKTVTSENVKKHVTRGELKNVAVFSIFNSCFFRGSHEWSQKVSSSIFHKIGGVFLLLVNIIQVTPLEVDIMFQLCDLERKTGCVSLILPRAF